MIGKSIHEINIGDSASFNKVITKELVEAFGDVIEDHNPAHYDDEYAASTMFKKRISHGMFIGSLFSSLLGMKLPGKGTIYLGQSLKFLKPVYFDDVITVTVIVKEKIIEKNRVILTCEASNQNDKLVVVGEATVMPVVKE